jgi:hypothetical protein
MQDTELLLSLAEIAGVFVGFGALIAVRSGGASGPLEVPYMRTVVSMGMLTVVAALAPVTLDRFGLSEHMVRAVSSALVLVGGAGMVALQAGTAEYRAGWSSALAVTEPRWMWVVGNLAYVVYMLLLVLTPIAIILSLLPDLEAALYIAVVVLILLGAGWSLLYLVFRKGSGESRPEA